MDGLAVIQKCLKNMKDCDGHDIPPHPNVIFTEVHGKFTGKNGLEHPYSTVCNLQQEQLGKLLRENPGEQTVKTVLLQLAHAVNHIHKNGWTHGIIAMENIYIADKRALLRHACIIDPTQKVSWQDKAGDIADLQKIFDTVLKMNERKIKIEDSDSGIADDLLNMMKRAPEDAFRKNIAEHLLGMLNDSHCIAHAESLLQVITDSPKACKDSIVKDLLNMFGMKKSIAQELLREIKECAPGNSANGILQRLTQIKEKAIEAYNKSDAEDSIKVIEEYCRKNMVQDLLLVLEGARASDSKKIAVHHLGMIEGTPNIYSPSIAQDLITVIASENSRNKLSLRLIKILEGASENSLGKDFVDQLVEMIKGVSQDKKKNHAKALVMLIGTEFTTEILRHPYFWDTEKKLNFLSKVNQFTKNREIGKPAKDALDAKSKDVFGVEGWIDKLEITDDEERTKYIKLFNEKNKTKNEKINPAAVKKLAEREMRKDKKKTKKVRGQTNGNPQNSGKQKVGVGEMSSGAMEKEKQYQPDQLHSLLNFIRNRWEHYWEDSPRIQACFEYDHTDGYWKFFSRRFPRLLPVVYEVFKDQSKEWKDSGIADVYLETITKA